MKKLMAELTSFQTDRIQFQLFIFCNKLFAIFSLSMTAKIEKLKSKLMSDETEERTLTFSPMTMEIQVAVGLALVALNQWETSHLDCHHRFYNPLH